MTTRARHPRTHLDDRSAAVRFQVIFQRTPTTAELTAFRTAHDALVLRIPGRARRRAARIITRC